MNYKNYVIHESNLLHLLESLVAKRKYLINERKGEESGRNKDKELRKNNRNEFVYDFNEIE